MLSVFLTSEFLAVFVSERGTDLVLCRVPHLRLCAAALLTGDVCVCVCLCVHSYVVYAYT